MSLCLISLLSTRSLQNLTFVVNVKVLPTRLIPAVLVGKQRPVSDGESDSFRGPPMWGVGGRLQQGCVVRAELAVDTRRGHVCEEGEKKRRLE